MRIVIECGPPASSTSPTSPKRRMLGGEEKPRPPASGAKARINAFWVFLRSKAIRDVRDWFQKRKGPAEAGQGLILEGKSR
jgi:hypothetical protein